MNFVDKAVTLSKVLSGKILYCLSGFIKRDKKLWAFGSFGIFNDNSKYLFLDVIKHHPHVRAVWISDNIKSLQAAKKMGAEAYHPKSLRGFCCCLRASVYFYSSYLTDINYYTSRNALKVNLWHGVPLKKIEFDIQTPPLVNTFANASWFTRFIKGAQHVKPDFVLAPSQFVADYSFKSAFRVNDDNIIISSYPRVSDLLSCHPIESLKSKFRSTVLYTPTWRDDGRDFIQQAGFDFPALNAFMKSAESVFIFKLHPSTKITLDKQFSNIIFADNQLDPNELLKTADVLITDYSSVYFDYLYLNKPIVFYNFDINSYMANREMYFDYDEYTPGIKVGDFPTLIAQLELLVTEKGHDLYLNERRHVASVFQQGSGGNEIIIARVADALRGSNAVR